VEELDPPRELALQPAHLLLPKYATLEIFLDFSNLFIIAFIQVLTGLKNDFYSSLPLFLFLSIPQLKDFLAQHGVVTKADFYVGHVAIDGA